MTTRTFADLGVSRPVIEALRARGIDAPFPVQSLVLDDAMAGRDVLGRSNTGSGKTLAFALPIVERVRPNDDAPAALVLVPTRELAQQVADEFADVAKVKGLRVGVAYGGTNVKEQSRGLGRAHVLIATPGRLQDIAERGLVRLERVRILILDEADRMLDMGFQPQVDRIVRRIPKDRQTMFFSATLDGAVGNLARAYTHEAVRHDVESVGETVEGVDHRFVSVSAHSKVETLIELLGHDGELTLVFVRTKRGADRLVHKLRAKGVLAEAMHGDMPQRARQRALERFEAAQGGRPGRDRRRRPRARPRRDQPRRELRPPAGRQGLRAPRRADGSRGRNGHRHHARHRRPARGHRPNGRPARAP